jgi:hypothetical protein
VARSREFSLGKLTWLTPLPRSRPLLHSFPSAVEAAMTPRKQKGLRRSPTPEPLRVTDPEAAGIDVHAAVHWVAVPPDHPPNLPAHVRPIGTCTADCHWVNPFGLVPGITRTFRRWLSLGSFPFDQ